MNSDQLQRETRLRLRMVPVAILAGLLPVIAAVTSLAGVHAKVDEETLALITVHKRFPLDLFGAAIEAGGLLALAVLLSFLWQATRSRKPELSFAFKILAIAGGALGAVATLAYQVIIAVVAHKFVSTGQQTYAEAHHLTSSAVVLGLPIAILFGDLLLAVATVVISLNAMRVGLLPRPMGYLGIFAGVLFVFQIGQFGLIIQAGWMCALAYLFLGRWPPGFPPAWESGEAVPWPSNPQARDQSGRPLRARRGKPAPAPAVEPAVAPAGATRSTTPKRKRKRRS
jgi:uncharacterized protein DUF4386